MDDFETVLEPLQEKHEAVRKELAELDERRKVLAESEKKLAKAIVALRGSDVRKTLRLPSVADVERVLAPVLAQRPDISEQELMSKVKSGLRSAGLGSRGLKTLVAQVLAEKVQVGPQEKGDHELESGTAAEHG